ncbi:M1 family metallopeptidase [Rhizosphaericola mali]|uniref:M1 family metallopeptidase n=1 Tax=Rhizosphaericola mali TaxID=2545455 RepID=A0A5P2G2K9_9BACT|nr:M1 family metallopeptidase [Rhizosphaericola mali]QES87333.1 M1 family metallopeptidase [Rhizosphaericola mali]
MKKILALAMLLYSWKTQAQDHLYVPRDIEAAFQNQTRSKSGLPGSKYWQNTANYNLDIEFNPTNRLLSGVANITYFNNSPDTLKEIVFKLYPNLYQAGAMRVYPIEKEDITDGMKIETMKINQSPQSMKEVSIMGTNMFVPVKGLLPHDSLHFEIHYNYTLNKKSHIRTGAIDDNSFFIAYFFPRIAVYDDIDGWNKIPYLGTYEFYNDFAHFDTHITVPQDYAIWATGDLQNGRDMYRPNILSKLAQAEKSDTTIDVITPDELSKKLVTTDKKEHSFHFIADNVTDFVFALSDHYQWQSSSVMVDSTTKRRTRVDAVFNPSHPSYDHVIGEARNTVNLMSHYLPKWPYPYPHETVFDGLDKMEYPMMVNDVPVTDTLGSFTLTSHEIFHTMFPFYMGINETKYGWMDEGWATVGEWILTEKVFNGAIDTFDVDGYASLAGKEMDLPIMTPTSQMQGIYYEGTTAFAVNSYPKPGLGYLYVRDLLGPELFTKALHHYIATWHGKHPIPYDFFNCMNEGSGQDLNWFWKIWFFESGFSDQAIETVKDSQITIRSKGRKPTPIDLYITYRDQSKEKIHRTIEVWKNGNSSVTIPLHSNKKIEKIVLGNYFDVDIDRSDNIWVNK